jgi:hypothetical protein
MLHILYLCHPIIVMVIDPISVENRIWVMGMELVRCDADSSRLVRCDAGSLWLVMIPKSKNWFVE